MRRHDPSLPVQRQPVEESSFVTVVDLNVARAPQHFREKIRKPHVETELRFFVPASLLKSIVGDQKPSLIVQSYLPQACIPELLERYQVHKWVSYADEFSVARIRAIENASGKKSYELEFKAPKMCQRDSKISRNILPTPIALSAKEFKDLERSATDGTLAKRRYVKHGLVGTKGSTTRCSVEIDEFLAGGIPLERFKVPLITLDMELADDTMVGHVISGEHSFSFLDRCIDMNYVNTQLCSPLSNRKVARKGLGSKQLNAIKALNRMVTMLAEA
jgi:hypothetical protein